jgi:hypothetical protein
VFALDGPLEILAFLDHQPPPVVRTGKSLLDLQFLLSFKLFMAFF